MDDKNLYVFCEKKIINIINNSKNPDILKKIVDLLYNTFDKYDWIGIYIIKNNNLVLGPWKGDKPTEHTIIPIGKGICGAAAKSGITEVVSNVKKDNRYLSCFIETKSEIVVPIKNRNETIGEIDIDSNKKNAFNKKDIIFLEKIADMLNKHIYL
jgi:putative methionine-R-sulfoxide reductase with GAF domain